MKLTFESGNNHTNIIGNILKNEVNINKFTNPE